MQDIYIESERLINELKATFGAVSRGSGVTLHEAEVIDDYGSDDERASARLMDTDNSWTELPEELISDHPSVLGFLDTDGFRYYLPAYLTFALSDLVQWDGPSPNLSSISAIMSLVPVDGEPRWRERDLKRYGSFSAEESRVICRVLRFVASNIPWLSGRASEALSGYWGQFCEANG
jgi:hypothetical protein